MDKIPTIIHDKSNNVIIIEITAAELKHLAESKDDGNYIVKDENYFLREFCFELEITQEATLPKLDVVNFSIYLMS